MAVQKKYLLNVDLSTKVRRVHLNPPVTSNCVRAFRQNLGEKVTKDGGILFMDERELKEIFTNRMPLQFQGKSIPFSHISRCGNCSKDGRFAV